MKQTIRFDLIRAFLLEQKITRYYIKPHGIIDIVGSVNLRYQGTSLPSYIQFGKVSGVFNCSWCMLTTLRGCPFEVGGDGMFLCGFNNLSPTKENFDIIYRCSGGMTDIDDNLKVDYYNYIRAKQRSESINELLR